MPEKIKNTILRSLVIIQFVAILSVYALITYKLFTKHYDARYCSDALLFNRISLFWFIHIVLSGAAIVLLFFCLRKIKPKYIILSETMLILGVFLFLCSAELFLRVKPEVLPIEILTGELGFKEQDSALVNKLKNSIVGRHNDDPELVFINKPNLAFRMKSPEFSYFFRTDKFGFQNYLDESLYNKADIVTVGDSFTEGSGASFEFSYPQQLARILNSRVLNLGHGGYDCYQFPIVLKRYGIGARPKIAVMSIWSWNDIHPRFYVWEKYCKANGYVPFKDFEDIKERWYEYRKINKGSKLEDFTPLMAKKIDLSSAASQELNSNEENKNKIYILLYLKYCAKQIKELSLKYQGLWNYGPYRGVIVNGKALRFPTNDGIHFSGQGLNDLLEYLGVHLAELKGLSEKYDFTPIVLFFPSKQVVYAHFLKIKLSPELGGEAMEQAIINTIKKFNLEILDMTPFFIESIESGTLPYHLRDDHLNKDGYTVTAKALANYLKNNHNFKQSNT